MKILIVQIGRIGDLVLITPMFREIHHKYPNAKIDILCTRQNYRVIEGNPHIHTIWIYKKGIQLFQLIFGLRAEKYDVWLDSKDHFSRESLILAKMSNAKMKIGWNKESSSVFTNSINQLVLPEFHRVQTNLASLLPLEISPRFGLLPELFPSIDSEQFVEEFLGEIEIPIIINISAGNKNRTLPVETWQEIVNGITVPIILNFIPNDVFEAQRIKGVNPNIYLFPSRSVADTVSLVKRARIVISPDTAIIHIAAAFNIPVLGIYSNLTWNYQRFQPLSTHSVTVFSDEGKTIKTLSSDKILTALKQFPL